MKKEPKSFLLLPPSPFLGDDDSKGLENYLNIVLHDLKEEGGKYNVLIQKSDYRESGKIENIKNLFGKKFESIEKLKETLKKGEFENTANSIEMQPVNMYGVGKITYKADNKNEGDFALYIPGI